MNELLVRRIGPIDGGLLSHWIASRDGIVRMDCWGVEDPANAIPAGEYLMQRDATGKHQWWVVTGPNVGLYGSGEEWEQVEVHAGNHGSDSDACLCPGSAVAYFPTAKPPHVNQLGVTDSVMTLRRLRDVFGDEDVKLTITER